MVILGNHLSYDKKKDVTYFGILNFSSKFRKRHMRSQASNHQKTKKITDLVVEPFQIGRCLYQTVTIYPI
jgi:hypothetical protein